MASFGTHRVSTLLAGAFVALVIVAPARATFHFQQVNELYSNADGSIQFIELFTAFAGQEFFFSGPGGAVDLLSVNVGSTLSDTYTFTSDSPSPSNNHHLLLATPGFASLGIVTPDFIFDAGFMPLFVGGGTLTFSDSLFQSFGLTYGALPTDGILSINAVGSSATNSPTNYAGDTGSVPEPTTLSLLALGGIAFSRRSRVRRPSAALL